MQRKLKVKKKKKKSCFQKESSNYACVSELNELKCQLSLLNFLFIYFYYQSMVETWMS